jgi:hypothetical protein
MKLVLVLKRTFSILTKKKNLRLCKEKKNLRLINPFTKYFIQHFSALLNRDNANLAVLWFIACNQQKYDGYYQLFIG